MKRPFLNSFAAILVLPLVVHLPASLQAQTDVLLGRPDFQNLLFDPAPDIPDVPTLTQAPAVTLISGGVWAPGKPGTPTDGGIELLQALVGQPVAPAAFWYLAPAPLPVQSHFLDERLSIYSAVDYGGRYRNHYAPMAEWIGFEHAALIRGIDLPALEVHLVDARSGEVLGDGRPSASDPSGTVLTFPYAGPATHTVRVAAPTAGLIGRYEIAFYPVLRPAGPWWQGTLSGEDRSSTNRVDGVGLGPWYFEDYLLQGVAAGERIAVRVLSSDFTPFVEERVLPSESERRGHADLHIVTVGGGPGGPRDHLIRVTTDASGALGGYRVKAGRIPEIWSISPAAGLPGTLVTVRGTNFLDADNPVLTDAKIGGVPAGMTDPIVRNGAHEVQIQVPLDAVTGPIFVQTDVIGATSSNAFVVLAAVGAIRREAGGSISFGVSNAVAGLGNVVEATASLTPPIAWERVATNAIATAGVWRFTNASPGLFPQRFFRVRKE